MLERVVSEGVASDQLVTLCGPTIFRRNFCIVAYSTTATGL